MSTLPSILLHHYRRRTLGQAEEEVRKARSRERYSSGWWRAEAIAGGNPADRSLPTNLNQARRIPQVKPLWLQLMSFHRAHYSTSSYPSASNHEPLTFLPIHLSLPLWTAYILFTPTPTTASAKSAHKLVSSSRNPKPVQPHRRHPTNNMADVPVDYCMNHIDKTSFEFY